MQEAEPPDALVAALPLLPQFVDTYILSSFLFYFALWLASFVTMAQVYNFFELMGDMMRTAFRSRKVFTYLFFLMPQLIYDCCPSACWWRCW